MHPFKVLTKGIKDIDPNSHLVTFYYNAFNNVDSDKDVSLPGSHRKSQQENQKRIKHFKNHDFYKVPGVIKEMGEDNYGAWARSELINTEVGRDTFEEYAKGAITEHSFGFDIIKSYDENGIRYIQEYKVWEVSSLTGWGANQNTPMINLKDEKQAFEYLNSLLSLKQISKENLIQLESKINEVLKYLKSLASEPPKNTRNDEPVIKLSKPLESILSNFNL